MGIIKCFTDGSKQNNKFGAAFVVYDEPNIEIYYSTFRLPDYSTVFAIDQAIKYLRSSYDNYGNFSIISDSKSALMSITNNNRDRIIIANIRRFLSKHRN